MLDTGLMSDGMVGRMSERFRNLKGWRLPDFNVGDAGIFYAYIMITEHFISGFLVD